MIKQGISLPTLIDLENKTKAIDKFKCYVYNDKDITKMVEEKSRFRKTPINYAMSKNDLLKEIVRNGAVQVSPGKLGSLRRK